jgi:two-component system cell cycle sensor histidine kinase/response regulator CckA
VTIDIADGAGIAPARRPAGGDEDPPQPGAATILVVDDDEAVRRWVVRVLSDAGYTVLEAAGGREGIQAVFGSSGGPDLLLTDIQMPEIDGEQLAGIVHEARPGCAVVFMSGDAGNLWRVGHSSQPAPLLLAKPFGRPELLETVAAALQRDKRLRDGLTEGRAG